MPRTWPRCVPQRLAAILMQGSRMSLGCDELEHVAVVPGSLLAPATEAGLGAPVPGDQVEGDLAKQSEVARSRHSAASSIPLSSRSTAAQVDFGPPQRGIELRSRSKRSRARPIVCATMSSTELGFV